MQGGGGSLNNHDSKFDVDDGDNFWAPCSLIQSFI
jgi:hypothetical protein